MNDPRRTTVVGDATVTSFVVNDRRALVDEVRSSEFVFPSLSEPEREALVELVREALTRLAADPAAWLPDAVARSDTEFGIFILWENGHLDREVIDAHVRSRRALADCRADLQRLAGNG